MVDWVLMLACCCTTQALKALLHKRDEDLAQMSAKMDALHRAVLSLTAAEPREAAREAEALRVQVRTLRAERVELLAERGELAHVWDELNCEVVPTTEKGVALVERLQDELHRLGESEAPRRRGPSAADVIDAAGETNEEVVML